MINWKKTQILLYFFIIMFLFISGCSSKSDSPASTSTAFSQSDLTGTWNFTGFQTGSNPGWDRGTISINSSGALSFTSYEDIDGNPGPSAGAVILTINSSGIVTESGTGKSDESHCTMSTDKNTVLCVATNGSQYGTRILVKTTGVTFSNSDLTGPLSFNLHGISSGGSSASDRYWFYKAGTINSSRQVTITESQNPDGAQTLPAANSSTFTVGSNGFVTISPSEGDSWKGMLSSDKKMMVITTRNGGSPERYGFAILTIADETFTGTSDLAGDWKISTLYGGDSYAWAWIDATINSAGLFHETSFLDSTGSTTGDSDMTCSLTSSGIFTIAASPTYHGILSHNRLIGVFTVDSGVYALDIWLKR